MTVPTFDAFIAPLLTLLGKHPDGIDAGDAQEKLADEMKLSDADRAELLPSQSQAVYKNRIGWAHDRLKRHGLSASPKRGFWKLTDEGRRFVAAHPTMSEADIERIAEVPRTSRLRPIDGAPVPPEPVVVSEPGPKSPDERIEDALRELRESVAQDLLERIAQAPPAFFEQLVLDLLHAMGYGTSREDLQRVGGSGDGGIDGIISLDRLGLEKVYVQAKRWKNKVGSPEVQGFLGALQLQGASKGVFLTTSRFTDDAVDAAGRARGSVVLVDGARLAELMIDHRVAVSHREVRIPRVDGDYFEDA